MYLDPPVRLLPQYDNRWKNERIGGPKTGKLIDWIENGCNAATAAMILGNLISVTSLTYPEGAKFGSDTEL